MSGTSVEESGSTRARAWGLALVLLLGLLVQLPTLRVGFFADDYAQQLVLRGERGPTPIPRWSLYDFGTAASWADFGREHEALPWWTSSDWKVRFFRPLTSFSLELDFAAWGREPLGYHVTNLVLWMALLVVVYRMYRALGLAQRVAELALFVFVLSDASSVPVGWIANRNSLLEALFAVGAVLAALRERSRTALLLALAATLSKESGVVAFLFVAAIVHVRGWPKLARLALVAVVAELAFLAAAGYGTRSLFYATPWHAPLRTLVNLAELVSGGVLALLGPIPLDLVTLLPAAGLVLLVLGVLVGWPLAARIVRSVPPGHARVLLAAWTVFFLLPQAGAAPADRLLFVPSIGAAALCAMAWSAERARWSTLARGRRLVASALALSVTLGSGLYLLAQNATVLPGMANHLRATARAAELGPATGAKRDVLVLQTESQMQGFTLAATWHAEVDDDSVRFALLQCGPRALRWTRTDERAFEFESLGRCFLDLPFERVYRSDEHLEPGMRWRTPDFEVEALAVDDGCLRRFRVTLDRSLDDPSLRFVRPIEGVLRPIAPPAIGASIELAEVVPTLPYVP
jgi:hypothetical protein